MGKRIAKRIMLIGWDAADWEFINPLIDMGLMPNLKRLMENGVMGKIATLSPMLSPMLWNSIATGKLGHKHDILGFVEPNGQGSVRPVSSTSRKAKALWNILSQNDLRSCVVGWFASHPAEKINGVVFSDRYEQTVGNKADSFPLDAAAIHPPEMFEIASQLQVRPADLHDDQVLPFVPLADEVDQTTDQRIALIAKTLCEVTTIHNAATYLAEHETWDFLAVYMDFIDHMGHGFMEYHPPKMAHVKDADARVYAGTMTATYVYSDMMLGRLMELAGEETHIMLLSDHGFHNGEARPKIADDPAEPGKQIGPGTDPLAWHRRHGVFVLSGPGVKKDELVHGMTLLDVCPTILTMLGLPVARDMDGTAMTQVFVETPTVEFIDSYEAPDPKDGVYRGEFAEDPYAAQQALQQLIDLGYVEKPGEDQDRWIKNLDFERRSVLAQVLYAAREFDQAETLLRQLVNENANAGLACRLVMVLMDQQKPDEAEQILAKYEHLNQDMPFLLTLKGQLAYQRGKFEDAFALFERALAADPRSPQVHVLLGQIHVQKKRYAQAEETFRKALEIDADSAEAHDGLGSALSGQGKLEDALFHHMQSAALLHHRWTPHYNMGLILLDLGRTDWGIRAMETASELNPDLLLPHRVLARVYRRRKNDAESAMKHLRILAEKRAKKRKAGASFREPSPKFDDTLITATTRFDIDNAPKP